MKFSQHGRHMKDCYSAHCDLEVSRSHAKIYENFANYFLNTKANKKCFTVLKSLALARRCDTTKSTLSKKMRRLYISCRLNLCMCAVIIEKKSSKDFKTVQQQFQIIPDLKRSEN